MKKIIIGMITILAIGCSPELPLEVTKDDLLADSKADATLAQRFCKQMI